MNPPARDRARAEQRRASDPAVSAFVAASAGSGKTKLLTDRLLRLMLGGADPARILCLTFTKAAAAEMALRLQATLGRWVTLPDAALDAALAELDIAPAPAQRAAARALFARVLDLPGGARIGTIHAFCQSLLRRFPLEAQLTPHFGLLAEADADLAVRAAQEEVLAGAHGIARRAALQALAGTISLDQFGALAAALRRDPERLRQALRGGPEALQAALTRALGGAPDDASALAAAVAWAEHAALHVACTALARLGSAKVAERAERLLAWLGLAPAERAENWAQWCGEFLLGDGAPRGPAALINPKLAADRPDLAAALAAEQQRILDVEDARRAPLVAAFSAALAGLAHPVAEAFASRKQRSGLLDFDDLIARTGTLLVDPGAAWVLYKLDGGLDHLLLDEVQDTAPAQWRIAAALTVEFFAGAGAREDVARTVFAVGDRKQSIYSFQGADPDAFAQFRESLRGRVAAAGLPWEDVTLDVSFRSTEPVLALVDAVFAAPAAAAGVGEGLRHHADRAGHAGSVELWPLVPPPEVAPPVPWQVPERNLGGRSAMLRLADALAGWIARETGGATLLASRGRPLAPGDVLVLVRRRNAFGRALVRALKQRGVPVAGLDRLVLTEQPAVADLLALADVLLLPQDDLALAAVLTSPLGGLADPSLMELAAPREGTLWEALCDRAGERPEWLAARRFLAALFARVDYASPHALFAEALGPLGGRARLLARLGPDAAEPIDELLNAALAYAALHPPAMQGFLHWLRASGAEVKREAEGAGGSVRVMTVHGAKGLQAPLVILPDTTALPPDEERLLWTAAEGTPLPVWAPRKALSCAGFERLREAAARRRLEEHNRLLYVALTRAEDRLVVCGWQPGKDPPDTSWYRLVASGFRALGAAPAPLEGVPDPWAETCLRHAAPQRRPPERPALAAAPAAAGAFPPWAGGPPDWHPAPPPPEPAPPVPLAPSRPEAAAFGPLPAAASPLAERDATGQRFRRGRLVHALLQHLPALPAPERPGAARRYLDRAGLGLPPGETGRIAADVLAVLEDARLAPLFGPAGRAEVPLAGVVAGRVVGGLVDRLAVLPDRVLIADYKANRTPPATVADVPLPYLRQMAAYRAVLRAIHPDRPVACALVWTTGARVMELPAYVLDRHAPGAALAA
jgi:ATP-dependent helicase/nuclease subunit A